MCAALATLGTGPARAQPPAAPTVLEIDESTVNVRLASKGGNVVLFGFAHEEKDYVTTLVRREEILEDTDRDGKVSLDLGYPVPVASIWVGIDLQTGDSGVAAPAGRPWRELVLPPPAIAPNLRALDLELRMLEVLLVRPGVGASAGGVWGMRVGDGGEADEDGEQDGTLRAALADMWSVGDSALPPAELSEGDVLVLVDPLDLRVVVVRLAAGGSIAQ